jgi:tetratricopeptide (TPR) repeat protein
MVDAAVARARRDFAQQPRLRGELLGELGRMHLRLERRSDGAGSAERRRVLAETAVADCRDDSIDCAKARYYAHRLLANHHNAVAATAPALQHARQAVDEAERGFGPADTNTAAAYEQLAVIARNAGRFVDAGQAADKAIAIADRLVMRASARASLQRTQALIDIDLGRHADAALRLRAMLDAQPADGQRAFGLRLLATAELGLGRAQAAADAAQASTRLAQERGDGVGKLLAEQVLAQAQALLGDADGAVARQRSVLEALPAAGLRVGSTPYLRAQRVLAETQMRAGQLDAAAALLAALDATHRAAPQPHRPEWARTLYLLGVLAAARAQHTEAAALQAQALARLEGVLPAAHSSAAQSRFQLALTQRHLLAGADAEKSVERALREALSGLPQDSVYRLLFAKAAAADATHPAGAPSPTATFV